MQKEEAKKEHLKTLKTGKFKAFIEVYQNKRNEDLKVFDYNNFIQNKTYEQNRIQKLNKREVSAIEKRNQQG